VCFFGHVDAVHEHAFLRQDRVTLPSLPRSLPLARGFGHPSGFASLHSENLRLERNDAHEALSPPALAPPVRRCGCRGLLLIVMEDGGVLIEANVAAVDGGGALLPPDDDASRTSPFLTPHNRIASFTFATKLSPIDRSSLRPPRAP